MALDENIQLVRDLQKTGNHLARLTSYMSIGVQPSRDNLVSAQRWFRDASEKLDPILQAAEADRVSTRLRNRVRG